MTDGWDTSWMFMETKDGRVGSLRGIQYADPPLAYMECGRLVEMPDPLDLEEAAWKVGESRPCPGPHRADRPRDTCVVRDTFWHEPYAWIEWYREAGAGDWVHVEDDEEGALLRPANWRPRG